MARNNNKGVTNNTASTPTASATMSIQEKYLRELYRKTLEQMLLSACINNSVEVGGKDEKESLEILLGSEGINLEEILKNAGDLTKDDAFEKVCEGIVKKCETKFPGKTQRERDIANKICSLSVFLDARKEKKEQIIDGAGKAGIYGLDKLVKYSKINLENCVKEPDFGEDIYVVMDNLDRVLEMREFWLNNVWTPAIEDLKNNIRESVLEEINSKSIKN